MYCLCNWDLICAFTLTKLYVINCYLIVPTIIICISYVFRQHDLSLTTINLETWSLSSTCSEAVSV